jgi:hypothetical protein
MLRRAEKWTSAAASVAKSGSGTGVVENKHSTDGQIAINRQIDVRELRVNAKL